MKKELTIRLDPETATALERAANDLGKSKALIIRELLARFLADREPKEVPNDPGPPIARDDKGRLTF
jgi:predicted DNA-binding protein